MSTEEHKAKQRGYQQAYRERRRATPGWVKSQTQKRRAAEKNDPQHAEKKRGREKRYYAGAGKSGQKRRAYLREWERNYYNNPKNKAKRKAQRAALRDELKKTPEGRAKLAAKVRAANLKRNYGITPEQVDSLWEQQHRACPICQSDLATVQDGHVDHCHETNKVRGLLCMACNVGLGLFKERADSLRNAAEYVLLHKARK